MSVVARRFTDRAGNQIMQYLSARGYAESIGAELQTDPWFGDRVFGLDHHAIKKELPQRADLDLPKWRGEGDIELTGWCLHQNAVTYTRSQAREWLHLSDEMLDLLTDLPKLEIACHLRWGDFKSMEDFIAISIFSYEKAIQHYFGPDMDYRIVCEWEPIRNAKLEALGLGWLSDFHALMRADTLFRANSTFSFCAHLLGSNTEVFSPNVEGIKPLAGVFQEVPFSQGNFNAISRVHSNCSDLHIAP